MAAPPSTKIDIKTLEKAASISVWSETGQSVTFSSLFEKQKTIVIFIRQPFLVWNVQSIRRGIGKVPKGALDAAGTRIVVIGCGEWSVINDYKKKQQCIPVRNIRGTHTHTTSCPRTRLRLEGPTGDEPHRKYAPGVASTVFSSIREAFSHLRNVPKVGNFSQLGGDFILGPGLNVTYAWRMRNSQDHVEVTDLMHQAGVTYPAEAKDKAAS